MAVKKDPSFVPIVESEELDQEISGSEDVSFDEVLDEEVISLIDPEDEREPPTEVFRPRVSRKSIPTPSDDWPPKPGTVLFGKFELQKVLGRGGMGIVVVARHLMLGQEVAIKFLHPVAMKDQDVMVRFVREARALASIQSEHVVRILDVGALEAGEPYMVMECLEGTDLGRIVKQRGPLPIDEAVDYVIQACEPLAEAHAAGIIHRDLKPSNLYLAERPDGTYIIKVIDFGIAKMVPKDGEEILSMTKSTNILGSPLYISPEQLRNAKGVDARADIWSLGVILYKLITGKPPFMASTVAELCTQIIMEPTPLAKPLRPEIPDGLQAIISKCLEKHRSNRYANVAELATALLEFAPPESQEALDAVTRAARFMKTKVDGRRTGRPPPPASVRPAPAPARMMLPTPAVSSLVSEPAQAEPKMATKSDPPTDPVATSPWARGKPRDALTVLTPSAEGAPASGTLSASASNAERKTKPVPRWVVALGGGGVVLVSAMLTLIAIRWARGPSTHPLRESQSAVEEVVPGVASVPVESASASASAAESATGAETSTAPASAASAAPPPFETATPAASAMASAAPRALAAPKPPPHFAPPPPPKKPIKPLDNSEFGDRK
jgi:serine/threonine-protein kinase